MSVVPAKEKDLVQEIRLAAKAMSVFLVEMGQRKAKGSGSTIGLPDLAVIVAGETVWIECKRPGLGCLSVGQIAFIERAAEQGVAVHVVDDVQQFADLVNAARRRR